MTGDSNSSYHPLTGYTRFLTREVAIGGVYLGGNHPIRVQSMTTTDTMDTQATIEQTLRMVHAGCEYVRITAPSIKEAQNLAEIKKGLALRGCHVPLIADIHFTPNAAELAARIVEKVRINPGNYADRKKFETLTYSAREYEEELERIRKKFVPLIKVCKAYGTALRIGTNHGSLSDRIMGHYGDTAEGMVESAMEFIRICEEESFHALVISMKSSNPQVMVWAYRLLVSKMRLENMNYPLHLGVTEAGDGLDGRIKSALGIGTLLEDGLGDTIRVSLTEAPEEEVPVAKMLVERYQRRIEAIPPMAYQSLVSGFKIHDKYETEPTAYHKRETLSVDDVGGTQTPKVFVAVTDEMMAGPNGLSAIGFHYSEGLDKYHMEEMVPDYIFLDGLMPSFPLPAGLKRIVPYAIWKELKAQENIFPLFSAEALEEAARVHTPLFLKMDVEAFSDTEFDFIGRSPNAILVLGAAGDCVFPLFRQLRYELDKRGIKTPVVLERNYASLDLDRTQLFSATDLGSAFIEGFGDGIWLNDKTGSFSILQASRVRVSKAEYISCPSCGRTLFDLMETTQMIRSKTAHLKGIKIGIMGCIVNGPGEMADADYGYVGSGPGKITLYRGKEVVRRNIDASNAVDELIEVIAEDGRWEHYLESF